MNLNLEFDSIEELHDWVTKTAETLGGSAPLTDPSWYIKEIAAQVEENLKADMRAVGALSAEEAAETLTGTEKRQHLDPNLTARDVIDPENSVELMRAVYPEGVEKLEQIVESAKAPAKPKRKRRTKAEMAAARAAEEAVEQTEAAPEPPQEVEAPKGNGSDSRERIQRFTELMGQDGRVAISVLDEFIKSPGKFSQLSAADQVTCLGEIETRLGVAK